MTERPRGRGEAWVLAQLVLLAAVAVVAAVAPDWETAQTLRRFVGVVIAAVGVAVGLSAARALGTALTVFPAPRPNTPLSTRGPYRVVRHPMYTALLLVALGATTAGSPWALVPTAALAVLLDRKAGHEEDLLAQAHPDYAALTRRVRWRFLPGVR
jgi:protein-S-isoprenylcysteine O-methyltransferase Ste14